MYTWRLISRTTSRKLQSSREHPLPATAGNFRRALVRGSTQQSPSTKAGPQPAPSVPALLVQALLRPPAKMLLGVENTRARVLWQVGGQTKSHIKAALHQRAVSAQQ